MSQTRSSSLRQDLRALAERLKERAQFLIFPDEMRARRQYHYRNGFYPDLRNPRDLSEKVLWLKLHDHSLLHTFCADKINARRYVEARLGNALLVPKILVTYDVDAVSPDAIPDRRFVVKTNHDQGGVFICLDRDAFDWNGVRSELRARMRANKYYDYFERQYKDIRPGVLVEQFIEGENGATPVEIKVNCFEGEPKVLQVILDRFGRRRQMFYDPAWRPLPMRGRAEPSEPLPRPARLAEILAAAKRLAEPFLFVRVDFLIGADGRPWFGEITFHPAAGLVRYRPPEMERALGEMIDLKRLGEFRRIQRRAWAEAILPGSDDRAR